MTIHEFLDNCKNAPEDEILASGMHRDTGHLTTVKNYDLENWLRMNGIKVPDSSDTTLLLARHLVGIEMERRKPYPSAERLARLEAHRDKSVQFWSSESRGFNSSRVEQPAAAPAAKEPKYRLPLGLNAEHPCHPKYAGKMRGQQTLVRDLFLSPTPAKPSKLVADKTIQLTAREATDRLVDAGFTCNQDPFRAIYFIMNDWKKRGWLQTL